MSQDVTLATIILHKKMTSLLYTSTFMLLKSLVADFGGNVCLLMFLPPNQSLAPRPEKWRLKQGSLSWGSIQQAPLASALRWYETPGSWIMMDYVQMIVPQSYPDSIQNNMPSINETPFNFSRVCRPFFYGCPFQQRILSQKCPAVGGKDNEDFQVLHPNPTRFLWRSDCGFTSSCFFKKSISCAWPKSAPDAMMIFSSQEFLQQMAWYQVEIWEDGSIHLDPTSWRSENGERPENKRNFPKPHVSEQPGVMLLPGYQWNPTSPTTFATPPVVPTQERPEG